MKLEVERHVQDNTFKYRPSFVPTPETGDSDHLVDSVDVTEVAAALRLCKGTIAPGQDEITYSILKKVPDCTLSALADLYTVCLTSGYFPKAWNRPLALCYRNQIKMPRLS